VNEELPQEARGKPAWDQVFLPASSGSGKAVTGDGGENSLKHNLGQTKCSTKVTGGSPRKRGTEKC